MKIDLAAQREFAIDAVRKLRAGGFLALWAGGCVRDQLLQRTPKDYDVATNASPEEIRQLFGKRRTIPVGAAFGVITVLGPSKSAGQIDVVTFRHDVSYSDGRRPDSVTFSTPEVDAQRRDFTINGLFFDPLKNEVIDYVGGQEDLARRMIRAIGNPTERFAEDKLRMLRAVRFAAMYDFQLESATRDAIRTFAREITVVSVERIAAEMRRMLKHSNRALAVSLLAEVGLLPVILPEVGGDFEQTLAELGRLEGPTFPLSLAVLLRTFGDEELAAAVGARWKLSNKEIERTAWLLKHQQELVGAAARRWSQLQPLLIHEGIAELLSMHAAIHPDAGADIEFCQTKLALPPHELNPPPLITGDDLRAAGISPGPEYQRLLEAVRRAQLDGEIANSEEAIALGVRLWRRT